MTAFVPKRSAPRLEDHFKSTCVSNDLKKQQQNTSANDIRLRFFPNDANDFSRHQPRIIAVLLNKSPTCKQIERQFSKSLGTSLQDISQVVKN